MQPMSYTDWRDWALGEGADCPADNQETWRRVAENADAAARYKNPDVQPEAYGAIWETSIRPRESSSTRCVGIRTTS